MVIIDVLIIVIVYIITFLTIIIIITITVTVVTISLPVVSIGNIYNDTNIREPSLLLHLVLSSALQEIKTKKSRADK